MCILAGCGLLVSISAAAKPGSIASFLSLDMAAASMPADGTREKMTIRAKPTVLQTPVLLPESHAADIAAELGVDVATVISAARRHRIPSRPPGVHGRPEMITRLDEDISDDWLAEVDPGEADLGRVTGGSTPGSTLACG